MVEYANIPTDQTLHQIRSTPQEHSYVKDSNNQSLCTRVKSYDQSFEPRDSICRHDHDSLSSCEQCGKVKSYDQWEGRNTHSSFLCHEEKAKNSEYSNLPFPYKVASYDQCEKKESDDLFDQQHEGFYQELQSDFQSVGPTCGLVKSYDQSTNYTNTLQ